MSTIEIINTINSSFGCSINPRGDLKLYQQFIAELRIQNIHKITREELMSRLQDYKQKWAWLLR